MNITFESVIKIKSILKRTKSELFNELVVDDLIVIRHELNTNHRVKQYNTCYYDVICNRIGKIRREITMFQLENILKNFEYEQLY